MLRYRPILTAIAAFLTVAAFLPLRISAADSSPSPAPAGIVFLHLKLLPNSAELIGFEVTPGRLKPGPQHAGERILLVVESATGAPLWRGTIDDPRTEVIEHLGHGGVPSSRKVIERGAPELTTRVPFFENGQVVRISRVTPGVAVANEKLLGTFRLAQ